jgi:hypothetical protein
LRHGNFYNRDLQADGPEDAVKRAPTGAVARFAHLCGVLIAQDVHPKTIEHRLGHSGITVTLDRDEQLFARWTTR